MMFMPISHMALAVARMTSPRGRCHTFDHRADGYGRGEAIVTLVLECDATPMLYVPGAAVRQDGRSASLTAPNGQAQADLLFEAHRRSGVSPDSIMLIEAHGTGTVLGDPVEVAALMSGLSDPLGSSGESVRVGSLKANAGHAEASAGAAGLTKLVLEADKQRVASNAQLRAVNMHVDQVLCGLRAAVVFAVQRSAIKEPILCGGVSSFGYSGTIAHAILFARGDQAPMQTSYTYKRQAFPWRTPPHLSAQCSAKHVTTKGAPSFVTIHRRQP